MKTGFSLVGLMIAVAILAILAAIVVPYFHSRTREDKETVVKLKKYFDFLNT